MDKTIEKVMQTCIICDKVHEVNLKVISNSVIIKGELIDYEERFYECRNFNDDNEFVDGKLLNENIVNA